MLARQISGLLMVCGFFVFACMADNNHNTFIAILIVLGGLSAPMHLVFTLKTGMALNRMHWAVSTTGIAFVVAEIVHWFVYPVFPLFQS